MLALDFLFYYLTYWFDENREKLSWSTPIERSTYAIGLMTMAALYSLDEWIEWATDKQISHVKWYAFLACALAVFKLYDHIYITKKRYDKIKDEIPHKFKFSDDTGAYIAIGILALLMLSPFIVSNILFPFH